MAFLAGQKATAAQLNSAAPVGEAEATVNTTPGTTTSTSYTDTLTGSGTMTIAYVAPPSGKICVWYTASTVPSVANYFGIVAPALTGAAGTVAASDNWQAFNKTTDASNDNDGTVYRTHIFTGLVAGAAGTITMMHKVIGGLVTFSDRQIGWRPIGA